MTSVSTTRRIPPRCARRRARHARLTAPAGGRTRTLRTHCSRRAGRASEAPCPAQGADPHVRVPSPTRRDKPSAAEWNRGPFEEPDGASRDSLGFASFGRFSLSFSSSTVSVSRSPISNSFSPFPLFFSHQVSHGCPSGTLAQNDRPPRAEDAKGTAAPVDRGEQPTAHGPHGLPFQR